jgi:putative DNA primase/helicase
VRAANALRDVSDDIGKIVDALKRYNATFPEPKTEREVLHIATSICKSREGQGVAKCDTEKVEYIYDKHIDRAVDFCLDVLSKDEDIYVIDHEISEVQDYKGDIKIYRYNEHNLQTKLAKHIDFKTFVEKKDGERTLRTSEPPVRVVRGVLHDVHKKNIRKIDYILKHPAVLSDYSFALKKGYYAQNGLFLTDDFVCDDNMGVDEALEFLKLLVCDFPFKKETHRSSFFAALFTPFFRHAFDGPSPMFLVEGNDSGAGKTLLCEVISLVLEGQNVTPTTSGKNDEEIRKNITRFMLEKKDLVWYENVENNGFFGGPVLDALITSTRWDDRKLGGNEGISCAHKTTFYANGNNINLRGDIGRRIVHVYLDYQGENPHEREDYVIKKLKKYTLENRKKIISSILTLINGWIKSKTKGNYKKAWGSFEEWSDHVRSLLYYYGFEDPYDAVVDMREASDVTRQTVIRMHDLFELFGEKYEQGITCQEIISEVTKSPHVFGDGESLLREVAWENGQISSIRLGYFLRGAGKTINGMRIEGRVGHKKTKRWKLYRPEI